MSVDRVELQPDVDAAKVERPEAGAELGVEALAELVGEVHRAMVPAALVAGRGIRHDHPEANGWYTTGLVHEVWKE